MYSIPPLARLLILLMGPVLALVAGVGAAERAEPGPATSAPYADEPPLAHTGGFGEPTCHACHFGRAVDAGEGTLVVEGLPDRVRPSESYRLAVRLAASMERAGFMLSVRRGDGTQAGTLTSLDTARVTVRSPDTSRVQYAHHTRAGTRLTATNRAVWEVEWRAPAEGGGSVVVNVGANAANYDASEFGDDVYTATERAVLEE